MNAIHINWTKPFINKINAPYAIEDFELLTTILSALNWRRHNGKISMLTDSTGAEYYRRIGIDCIWDDLKIILDDVDVNPDVFWAAGKLFALSTVKAPVAIIDTDFIVWEPIDFNLLADVTVIHFEDLYPDVYPPKEYFHMKNYTFDKRLDWSLKACNTAFCVIKSDKLLKLYTNKAIEFMRGTDEKNDRLKYMVFAEQRLLPMCAKIDGANVESFSNLDKLFSQQERRFTHTWGMKQQMRDNPTLRYDFCKRCINRIIHEFPQMYTIMREIDNLKQYF